MSAATTDVPSESDRAGLAHPAVPTGGDPPGAINAPLTASSNADAASQSSSGVTWTQTVMWWSEDFQYEFLHLYNHFVGHANTTRLMIDVGVLWAVLLYLASTDQSLVAAVLVAGAMWHIYAIVSLPARKRRPRMSGADLMDALAAVGRSCRAVATAANTLATERANNPTVFYPKVLVAFLLVGWLGRYLSAMSIVALFGSITLWQLSGVSIS